jgi:hypothetical protein
MIKMFKRIKAYVLRRLGVPELPPDIQITKDVGTNPLSFTLMVGFNVGVSDNNSVKVDINNLLFTSNGAKSRAFIEQTDPEVLKGTVSLLAMAVAQHMTAVPGTALAKTVPGDMVDDTTFTPVDPKLLN